MVSASERAKSLSHKPRNHYTATGVHYGAGEKAVGGHLCNIVPWHHTGFPSCCKVAENQEGIPSTALVGVDPVFACWVREGGESGP